MKEKMDFSSDAGADLRASKRIVLAGVLGLVALKAVSVCFHNYQLYEVERLVRHITHSAEVDKRRRESHRSLPVLCCQSVLSRVSMRRSNKSTKWIRQRMIIR